MLNYKLHWRNRSAQIGVFKRAFFEAGAFPFREVIAADVVTAVARPRHVYNVEQHDNLRSN